MKSELRFVLRILLAQKSYALTILVTLGLGLGLTTAAYSVLQGRFLRGLPYPGGDDLVRVDRVDADDNSLGLTHRDFRAWQESQQAFAFFGAWQGLALNLSTRGVPPEQYNAAFVSAGVLEELEVAPLQGAVWTREDHRSGAPLVVILGQALSRKLFGEEDPVGREIKLDDRFATVTAVMPPGFRFPINQDLWLPLVQSPSVQSQGEDMRVQIVASLPADKVIAAQAELAGLMPEGNLREGTRIRIQKYTDAYTSAQLRDQHLKLLALMSSLLLLCCANVANMVLNRTIGRSHELAVRASQGASRWHLLRLVVLEAMVLATGGGLLGFGVAWLAIDRYVLLTGEDRLPFWSRVELDTHVFLVCLGGTLLLGVCCGLLPALAAIRRDPDSGVLKVRAMDSRSERVRQTLVVAQVALCIALLLATALVVKSLYTLYQGLGFQPERILTAGLSLSNEDFADDKARLQGFAEVAHKVQSLPGVRAAGWTFSLPGKPQMKGYFGLEGEEYADGEYPMMRFSIVTPGFFRVFDLQPLKGRLLDAGDREDGLQVLLVNARFAEKYFGTQEVLEQRVLISGIWRTVVGVVPNLLIGSIEGEDTETVYLPLQQYPVPWLSLVLRSQGPAEDLVSLLRREVATVVPGQPLNSVRTMPEILADATRSFRASTQVFAVLGLLATCLALLGLAANLTGFVVRKQREIGIRMALGADHRRTLVWVLSQGGRLLSIGIVLGLLVSLNLIHLMESFLYRMSPWAPWLFTGMTAGFATLGILVCLFPALRATRLDPVQLLRQG